MRKSHLSDGSPFFGITIEHFVKKEDFAKHLAEHFDRRGDEFDPSLKKRDAIDILKKGLFFYGLYGEIETTLYEGSDHGLDAHNIAFTLALDWIEKNYPYLTK